MSDIRIDPKKQFSKRLARWTAVFWFLYMAWISVIMLLQPDTALYVFYMSIVISVVMIVNVIAYTSNSIQEKILFALLNKTSMEINIGGKKNKGISDHPLDTSDENDFKDGDENEITEEGENG